VSPSARQDAVAPSALRDHGAVDEQQRAQAVERLEMFDALVTAIDRRAEVLHVVEEAQDVQVAAARLRDLLGISEIAATMVLDLQVRRLTIDERARFARARDELRDDLSG
jgi:DNA gyrase/topoisomerase IV subunit A